MPISTIRTVWPTPAAWVSVLMLMMSALIAGCAQAPSVQSSFETGRPDVHIWPNSNSHSNNEATLTLLVKAGSLQEQENELGYAHFVEHMVFRGSEKYPGSAMQQQMDDLGLELGRHTNAYTTFDHTAYWIKLDSVEPERIETALELLAEWAFHAQIDPEAVAKERPVIVEEWRQATADDDRASEILRQDFLAGSRQGQRLPIGTRESIDMVTASELQAFYQRWYQPNNMAVLVTGDVDADVTNALVEQYFPARDVSGSTTPSVYDLNPDAMSDRLAVTDPYIPDGYLELMYFTASKEAAADWQARIALDAGLDILLDRLDALRVNTGGAVTGFQISTEYPSPSLFFMGLAAGLSQDDFAQAMNLMEGERQRILTEGITDRELAQWRRGTLNYERSQQDSADFLADVLIDHVLYDDEIVGQPEYIARLNDYLPTMTSEDVVQALSDKMNTPVKIRAVHPHGRPAPTPEQLDGWLAAAAYAGSASPLDELDSGLAQDWAIAPASTGSIVAEAALDRGITKWTLSNGMTVYYTHSDANPGRVAYHLVGDGGFNRMDEADTLTGRLAMETIGNSGLRDHSGPELRQWLEANAISLTPEMDFFDRTIYGSAPTDDFALAMNLLHIALTEAQVDPDVMAYHQAQNRAQLEQLAGHPHRLWIDTVTDVLFLQDPALRPMTLSELAAVDAEQMQAVYERHIAGAQNYALAIVGDLSRMQAQQAVQQAIATLPAVSEAPTVQRHYPAPTESASHRITGSGERQATMILRYGVPKSELELQQYSDLAFLERWLNHQLNQDIREEQGLTYSIQAEIDGLTRFQDHYTLIVYLEADPERVDEVKAAVSASLTTAVQTEPSQAQADIWKAAFTRENQQRLTDPAGVAAEQAYATLFEVDVANSLKTETNDIEATALPPLLAQFKQDAATRVDLVWLP